MNGIAFLAASTLTAALAAIWPATGSVPPTDLPVLAAPPSATPLTADWATYDLGAFRLSVPDETALDRHGRALKDRRFTLRYRLTARDANFAIEGQDYREVAVSIGGKPALLRTSEFPGTAEPYYLSLTVPHAVKARDGHWQAVEISGRFANRDRRWLGTHIVRTVDFAPAEKRSV